MRQPGRSRSQHGVMSCLRFGLNGTIAENILKYRMKRSVPESSRITEGSSVGGQDL